MAITKLMHMKESPHNPSAHLRNALNYILDVLNDGKKTGYGKWVGGNAGLKAKEIYDQFMRTKKKWGKEDGRQGYHFVISFPPDEKVDEQTVYNVAQDFCEEYFGDNYEYVFAVHNNEEHKHAHIIFNSLSRTTGYKYHYKKGDWEKSIQPITDRVCKKYNLPALEFDMDDRIGVTYAEWKTKKTGKINWSDIVRADIDYAISKASDMKEFFEIMKKFHYTVNARGVTMRNGKPEPYFTFSYYENGKKVTSRRSTHRLLGENYSPSAIENRIKNKSENQDENYFHEKLAEQMELKAKVQLGSVAVLKSTRTYYRLYQAVSYYKLPNPFAIPYYKVRRDIVEFDKLIEDCKYLKQNQDILQGNYVKRKEVVEQLLRDKYVERNYLKRIISDVEGNVSPSILTRYHMLKHTLLEEVVEEEWSAQHENMQEELEEIEKSLPFSFIDAKEKLFYVERSISKLKNEKQIITRIVDTEGGMPNEKIKVEEVYEATEEKATEKTSKEKHVNQKI